LYGNFANCHLALTRKLMPKKTALFRLLLLFFLLIACLLALRQGRPTTVIVAAAEQPADLMTSDPNCRYGVAAIANEQVPTVPIFHAGWFVTFESVTPTNAPAGSEFVRILGVRQNKDTLGQYLPGYYLTGGMSHAAVVAQAQAEPGSLWLIGNEVDRGPNPGQIQGGQGDMYPEVYATTYHELYYLIKAADPTARIGISGLVEVTPGRIQYLDKVWQAYYDQYGVFIPVDVWNMHLYPLPEAYTNGEPNGIANVALGADPALAIRESGNNPAMCPDPGVYCWAEADDMDIFKEQIITMRTWMKAHGQQNKPLILSEYSILYVYDPEDKGPGCYLMDEYGQCFTPERVSAFAQNSFDYLQFEAIDPNLGYPADNNRLIQQWLWFAIQSNSIGQASNLLESDLTTLTPAGQTYRNYVEALPANINLFPSRTPSQWATTVPPTTTADVPLAVWFRNNGNTLASPVSVTFYSDAALTQPIGTASVTNVRGCARDQYLATTTWEDLPAGVYRFWVKLDSAGTIVETNENDNVSTALVFVDSPRLYLPVMRTR
jgi:hypothetical protein